MVGEGQERDKGEGGEVAGAADQDPRRPTEPVHHPPSAPSTMFPKQPRPPAPVLPTCPLGCPSPPDSSLVPSLPLSFCTVSLRVVSVTGGKDWGRWGSYFSYILSTELRTPGNLQTRAELD